MRSVSLPFGAVLAGSSLLLAPLAMGQQVDGGSQHRHQGHDHETPSINTAEDSFSVLAQRQMAAVRQALEAFRYPEAAANAGYRKPESDTPTMGAHWVNRDWVRDGKIDLRQPEILMYADVDGKLTLVGVSYLAPSPKGAAFPEGFDGPHDAWHRHDPGEASSFGSGGARQQNAGGRGAGRGGAGDGMGIAMMHFWVVDAVNGPFTDHNHWLPFTSAGLPHPGEALSKQDPLAVAEAALALASVERTSSIMKRTAEAVGGKDKDALDAHFATVRALTLDYANAQSRSNDGGSLDALRRMAQEWRGIREIYLRNAPARQRSILTQAFDNMTGGHPHGHM